MQPLELNACTLSIFGSGSGENLGTVMGGGAEAASGTPKLILNVDLSGPASV